MAFGISWRISDPAIERAVRKPADPPPAPPAYVQINGLSYFFDDDAEYAKMELASTQPDSGARARCRSTRENRPWIEKK